MAVTCRWVGDGGEKVNLESRCCLREISRPDLVLPKELWQWVDRDERCRQKLGSTNVMLLKHPPPCAFEIK